MYGRLPRALPAALIGLAIAAFPGSALAGTAHVDGETLVYDAGAGEVNHVTVGQLNAACRSRCRADRATTR